MESSVGAIDTESRVAGDISLYHSLSQLEIPSGILCYRQQQSDSVSDYSTRGRGSSVSLTDITRLPVTGSRKTT